jgi:hypothetical protein
MSTTAAKLAKASQGRRELAEKADRVLSREEFERLVFARDGGVCLFCKEKAVDAHHIIERKLFAETGGYFLDNGASVCSGHHLEVEMTKISCGRVRRAAGINRVLLPEGFDTNNTYDKWGNIVLAPRRSSPSNEVCLEDDKESTYPRRPGPMFNLPNVQKIIKQGDMMWVFQLPIDNGTFDEGQQQVEND